MTARSPLAVRLGRPLLNLGGTLAAILACVLPVLGALALVAFEAVDEAVCGVETTKCEGPVWIPSAVLAGGIVSVAIGLLFVPVWLVHLAGQRRRRRDELMAAGRLNALDLWLMAGKLTPAAHGRLKGRLGSLARHATTAQVGRAAGALVSAFAIALLLLALAATGLFGLMAADGQNWAVAAVAITSGVAVAAATLAVLGLVALTACRRTERREREGFEAEWDQALTSASTTAQPVEPRHPKRQVAPETR